MMGAGFVQPAISRYTLKRLWQIEILSVKREVFVYEMPPLRKNTIEEKGKESQIILCNAGLRI